MATAARTHAANRAFSRADSRIELLSLAYPANKLRDSIGSLQLTRWSPNREGTSAVATSISTRLARSWAMPPTIGTSITVTYAAHRLPCRPRPMGMGLRLLSGDGTGQGLCGTAVDFDHARVDFEAAWRQLPGMARPARRDSAERCHVRRAAAFYFRGIRPVRPANASPAQFD
jgi:hypothetical protein